MAVQAVALAGVLPREGWLSSSESARAARFATAALRTEFIARRTALRIFAAGLLDADPDALTPWYSCPEHGSGPELDHGRPGFRLAGAPLPLSLSSSSRHGWLLLAGLATDGAQLGVDVEKISGVGFEGFDGMVLGPAEQEQLSNLADAERASFRARAWARKEAYSKALGTGLRGKISAIDSRRPGLDDVPNELLGLPAEMVAALALFA